MFQFIQLTNKSDTDSYFETFKSNLQRLDFAVIVEDGKIIIDYNMETTATIVIEECKITFFTQKSLLVNRNDFNYVILENKIISYITSKLAK